MSSQDSIQDSSQDPLDIIRQRSDGADQVFLVRPSTNEPYFSPVDNTSDDDVAVLPPSQEEYLGLRIADDSLDAGAEEVFESDSNTEGHARHHEDLNVSDEPECEGLDRTTTPPRDKRQPSNICLAEDTPAKQHTTSGRSYQMGDLGEMRQAVKDHIGSHAVELPFDEFVERFLPRLRDGFNTRAIRRCLIESGHVHRSKGVLTSFDTEPKRNKEREDNVLAPLSKTFAEVCSLASQSEPKCFLGMLPNYEPYAAVSMRHRPDGCLLPNSKKHFVTEVNVVAGETKEARNQRYLKKRKLTEEGGHFTLEDILVPLEGKKQVCDREDNTSKITFHGQQLIAHDPRRRFVIGITIENTDMRLWFFSRTTPFVSVTFNFTTEIERLIHVVLSLSFASREELGFDPTIQLVLAADNQQYDIVVGKRKFRTVRVIENVKAHALISTGTRVWIAIEEGPETEVLRLDPVIIKDAWIEDDRDMEMSIYERILEDVQREYGELGRRRVASGLMTPLAQWLVEIDGEYDCTRDVHSNPSATKLFPLKEEKRRPTPVTSGSRGAGPPGSHSLRTSPANCTEVQPRSQRKHYRVVFAEVGTPIYRVEKLSQAFLVLKDSTESLKLMHGSGWLHRDISVSNIYFYQGRGLIGDLEYARSRDCNTAAHNMRTKHRDCMACEVLRRKYLFSTCENGETPRRPFAHNELHDLESLWWTAVYMIFFMLDTSFDNALDKQSMQAKSQKREAARVTLFPGTDVIEDRQSLLEEHRRFLSDLDWVPGSLHEIRAALNHARSRLARYYLKFETNFDATDITEVYDTFIKTFTDCEATATSVENNFGTTLIVRSLDGPTDSATDRDPGANKTQGRNHQDRPEATGNNPGPSSGQRRRSEKRKRGSGETAGPTRPQIAQDSDSESDPGSFMHPLNPRGAKKPEGRNPGKGK